MKHQRKFLYTLFAFLLILGGYFMAPLLPGSLLSTTGSEMRGRGRQITGAGKGEVFYSQVPILLFHNLDGEGPYSISRYEFKRYLDLLKKRGVQVVTLHNLMSHAESGRFYTRPTVVITIDDDFTNAVRTGAPLLREYRYPATFFVYIQDINDHPRGGLSWDDLHRLKEEGFEIQNHSYTHRAFHHQRAGESAENYQKRLYRETILSRRILNRELGDEKGEGIYAFAFPMGYRTEALEARLKREGYSLLLTTDAKAVDLTKKFDGIFHRFTIERDTWSDRHKRRLFFRQLTLATTSRKEKSVAVGDSGTKSLKSGSRP